MTQEQFNQQIEVEKMKYKKQVAHDLYELRKRIHSEDNNDLYIKVKRFLNKVLPFKNKSV